ncbi:MAG: DUF3419 family protein [Thermodesulfobacteriota bacterium]
MLKTLQDRVFQFIHNSQLIYNTCWEDPWIDRELMGLGPDSKVVMITSAGCNALDYLLDGPGRIHAVDVNFRQNALFELKRALIERGDYEDFFHMFGNGRHERYEQIYRAIRNRLPAMVRQFWDAKIHYFKPKSGGRNSFYFHGTSGLVACAMRFYLQRIKKKAGPLVIELLDAESRQEQKRIFEKIDSVLWDRLNAWLVRQSTLMSMLGVPAPQIRLIESQYPGGLNAYVRDKIRHVFTEVSVKHNYFWRVYITGAYTRDCCPQYLKEENFETLRANISRVRTHTTTITDFLRHNPDAYTHFILLDHQDWMAGHAPQALAEEWDFILQNSRPGTRVLFRSAGADCDFLPAHVTASLQFQPGRTQWLHRQDRVGTYGSLHFAEIC